MFRVFLVDDEIRAREELRGGVAWGKLGFELAGETADGELALSLLRETRPELLITDIRMPYMDGMELCRRVRRELPDTRIVIVSACEDIGRAREAAALGVRAFLPKPVEAAALEEVLTRVAAELREERASREREASLRNSLAVTGRLLRERLLEELYGGADAEAVLRSARALRINLTAKRYLALLLRPEGRPGERELFALHGALEALGGSTGGAALLRRDGSEFSFLVLGDGVKHLHTRAAELADAAAREAECAVNLQLRAAFGMDVEHLADAPASLADARARMNRGQAHGTKDVPAPEGAETEDFSANPPRFLTAELAPLPERLRCAEPGDAESIVRHRAEELGAAHSGMLAGFLCVEAMMAAARLSGEEEYQLPDAALDALRAPGSPENPLPLCAEVLRRALEQRDARGTGRYGPMLRRARAYIDEHFADPNLTLRDVAAHVALSNNHFCTVFAREAGVTFGEYLTRLRIRRAGELLRETSLRTGEVAYAVGYNDPHYFSNLFKKRTGFSPRDFRREDRVKISE